MAQIFSCSSELISDGSVSQVQCRCPDGWTGDHCTVDFDSCQVGPCFENVTCTDHPAPRSGFTCGNCPSGLEGDGRICTDIDECANSTTHECQQVCINTFRSYICQCNQGYRLKSDGKTCEGNLNYISFILNIIASKLHQLLHIITLATC